MKSARLTPLALLASAAMLAGVFAIFFVMPDAEPPHGIVYRIIFIHVPSAWIAYLAFAVVLVGSIAHLRNGSKKMDWLAHASAEVGVLFTAICLVTGMVWAKPLWGAFWVWEPRLTLTFVLLLIYLGYLVFRAMGGDQERTSRIAAVIGITGFATIPLIHFAVDWYRGHHPGRAVIRPGGDFQLEPEMVATLFAMVAVFTVLYATLLALRIRLAGTAAQLEALR